MLPCDGRILDVSPEKPYLGICLALDAALLAELLAGLPSAKIDGPIHGYRERASSRSSTPKIALKSARRIRIAVQVCPCKQIFPIVLLVK
ncbi:MAG: AraC family transcriptional regulator N-terminal domain-containing protein [Treponema sp.]|nr:AraC family transcriptional regulator N-terminal domain-containing protein [Treponema sp.]